MIITEPDTTWQFTEKNAKINRRKHLIHELLRFFNIHCTVMISSKHLYILTTPDQVDVEEMSIYWVF